MKFKVGDIVVCVNNKRNSKSSKRIDDKLTINKKYEILYIDYEFVDVVDDNGEITSFLTKRFKTLSEIRLEKLKELRK